MGKQYSVLSGELLTGKMTYYRCSFPTAKLTNQVNWCGKALLIVVCACPRSLLRTTLEKIDDIGYSAKAGIEYEFCTIFGSVV